MSVTYTWPVPAAHHADAAAATLAECALDARAALLGWALTTLAAAGQRLAELQARLAQLESLSVTDELTKVLNRRGFLAERDRAFDATQSGGPAGVLMICDLDGFEAINDRHGHNAGKRVLRDLAACLARLVRRTDAVARLGGDEFGFLLIGASLATAWRKSQCFARALAALAPVIDGAPLPLSASFGLAAYDGSEMEEVLLHRADMAMYAEKRRRASHLRVVRSHAPLPALPQPTPAE